MRRILVLLAVGLMALWAAPTDDSTAKAVRATLENGLRVVIVRDPLAPVATLEANYLAGGRTRRPDSRGWRMHRSIWHSADARA